MDDVAILMSVSREIAMELLGKEMVCTRLEDDCMMQGRADLRRSVSPSQ